MLHFTTGGIYTASLDPSALAPGIRTFWGMGVSCTCFFCFYHQSHTELRSKSQNNGNCQYICLTKGRNNIKNISSEGRKFNFKVLDKECSLFIERESIISSSYILGQTIYFLNQEERVFLRYIIIMIYRQTYCEVMPSAVPTLSPFYLDNFITQVIRTEHIKQKICIKSETLPTPQLLTRIFSSPKLHRKIIFC